MPRENAPRGALTLSEVGGVRYLHFGTEWVQGAMRLAQPYRLELEYQQQMMAPLLFAPRPARVLQLGLGAAALTKFCHRHLTGSRIEVVEIDPAVVDAAHRWFALPADDARLRVLLDDAGHYLRGLAACADWMQVDLYDARARGPVLDDPAFYSACRAALLPGGLAAFNLFGSRLAPSLTSISAAFGDAWVRMPPSAAGNTVVLAFAGAPPQFKPQELERRAAAVERRFGWPMTRWLQGMRSAAGAALAPGPRPRARSRAV